MKCTVKNILSLFIVLSFSLVSIGCSRSVSDTPPTASPTASPTAIVTPFTTPSPSPTPAATSLKATGTYNGRIDSNFVEISLADGEIVSCKLSSALKENFSKSGVTDGDLVKFEYTEKDNVYTITHIEKK